MKYSLEINNGVPALHNCPGCGNLSLMHYIYGSGRKLGNNIGRCIIYKCGYDIDPDEYIKSLPKGCPYRWVTGSRSNVEHTGFVRWLLRKYPHTDVMNAAEKYLIGSTKDRDAIFWQVTKNLEVICGEVVNVHSVSGNTERIYRRRITGDNPFNHNERLCLYGEHLLNRPHPKKVVILKSELSAVESSIKNPGILWLASLYNSKDQVSQIKDYLPNAIWI
jgi:hypothetical protein